MSTAAANELAWLDRAARGVARHWLLLLNSAIVAYAALPWIAPLLERAGFERLGRFIFRLYSTVCHQLPERSFFVGEHQVCYCHRCTALYSTVALIGLLYGLWRWQPPLSNRLLLLASIPILIDGLWHIANDLLPGWGLRASESGVGTLNFWLRLATGILFGAAAALWMYPRFAHELREI